jgi:hypothetical protein
MQIRALSLQQPFANLVTSGKKTLETRKWTTPYRGDVLICASRSGIGEPKGVALCIVELVAIRPMLESDADQACIELYPGAQAWELTHLRRLKQPFPVKGQLGLFTIDVESALLET